MALRYIRGQYEQAHIRREVIRYRLDGWSWVKIGQKLHIGAGTAANYYYEALREIPQKLADDARREHVERLGRLREEAFKLVNSDAFDIKKAGIETVVRIDEREAKLMGLDAPAKLEWIASNKSAQDELTVEQLQNLSPDELRQLMMLMSKARAIPPAPEFDAETTGSPVDGLPPPVDS